MKFKRLLAVLLTITMLATLIPSVLVSAEGDINDGVVFTKTLVKEDGLPLRLKLEAYTTGQASSSTTTFPTDIVLVLDQSGSMASSAGSDAGKSKLLALQEAVTAFVKQVAEFNKDNNDKYRVAIVGFANLGNNTELLSYINHETEEDVKYEAVTDLDTSKTYYIRYGLGYSAIKYDTEKGAWFRDGFTPQEINPNSYTVYERNITINNVESVGVDYNSLTNAHYHNAFVNCTSATISSTGVLGRAIDSLYPDGSTRTDLGVTMAQRIFDNQPEGTYSSGRKKVVVVMTDGTPTTISDFEERIANAAISVGKEIKALDTHIFSIYFGTPSDQASSFLQALSSNYPNAETYDDLDDQQAGSYYSAHTDADEIAKVFNDIAFSIVSDTALDEFSITTDELSDYFRLAYKHDNTFSPDQIKVYTSDKTASGWAEEVPFNTAKVTLSPDNKTITVSGFNFSYHCVTEDPKTTGGDDFGKKIVIYFPIVEDENADTFGGRLPTNKNAAVYQKAFYPDPVETAFAQKSDVTLKYNLVNAERWYHIGTETVYDFKFSELFDEVLPEMITPDFIPDGTNNTGVSMEYTIYDTNLTAGVTNDDVKIAHLSVPVGADIDVTDFSNWTLDDVDDQTIDLGTNNSAGRMYVLACRLNNKEIDDTVNPPVDPYRTLLKYSLLDVKVVNDQVHIVGGFMDEGGELTVPAGEVIANTFSEEVVENTSSTEMTFKTKEGFEIVQILKKTSTTSPLDTTEVLYDLDKEIFNATVTEDSGVQTYVHQSETVTEGFAIEVYTRPVKHKLTTVHDETSDIMEGMEYSYTPSGEIQVYFDVHNGYKITEVTVNSDIYSAEDLLTLHPTDISYVAETDNITHGIVKVPMDQDNYVEVKSEKRDYKLKYNYYLTDNTGATRVITPLTGEEETHTVTFEDFYPSPVNEVGSIRDFGGANYVLKGWYTKYENGSFTGVTDISNEKMPAHDVTLHAFYEKLPDEVISLGTIKKVIKASSLVEAPCAEDVQFKFVAIFHEREVGVATITIPAGSTQGTTTISATLTNKEKEAFEAGEKIHILEAHENEDIWVYDDTIYDVDKDNTSSTYEFTNNLVPYKVKYDLAGGTIEGNTEIAPKTVDWDDANLLPEAIPVKSGTTFTGWKYETTSVENTTKYSQLAENRNVPEIVLVAQYRSNSGGGGGGGSIKYILTYETNGGTDYKDEKHSPGTVVNLDKIPVKEGFTFAGWHYDVALTEETDEVTMTKNITVYAEWIKNDEVPSHPTPPSLNSKDHFAYVIGYPDGTVRPNDNITRAEVASIFFRLLTEEVRNANLSEVNDFADIKDTAWHNTPISTMTKLGIVKGRYPGKFVPDANITRAEFAVICARFDDSEYKVVDTFTDISGHWAEAEIHEAAAHGWIKGYKDNTFKPDQYITRAEAMTLINRVLNRLPESKEDLLDTMIKWPDNSDVNAWYYLPVQEATNSHFYEIKNNINEKWTSLGTVEDWARFN